MKSRFKLEKRKLLYQDFLRFLQVCWFFFEIHITILRLMPPLLAHKQTAFQILTTNIRFYTGYFHETEKNPQENLNPTFQSFKCLRVQGTIGAAWIKNIFRRNSILILKWKLFNKAESFLFVYFDFPIEISWSKYKYCYRLLNLERNFVNRKIYKTNRSNLSLEMNFLSSYGNSDTLFKSDFYFFFTFLIL